jgi:hypothetical protein
MLTKMMSISGQDRWVKMVSPGAGGDKLTALACLMTKKVNKVEELTT